MRDLLQTINKALKGTSGHASAGHFRHENEVAILDAAKKLLAKSETGRELLQFASEYGIDIHVLRNKEEFGALPDQKAVFISCPAGQMIPTARAAIHLAGALREAMQEATNTYARPKSAKIGRERFIHQQLEQQKDRLFWQTAVVHEIHQTTGLLEIVDEFSALGYLGLYEAYLKDLENEARE